MLRIIIKIYVEIIIPETKYIIIIYFYSSDSSREYLCCLAPSNVQMCSPLPDQFSLSTCSNILSNEILRAVIWVIGTISVISNILSVIWHFNSNNKNKAIKALIINLSTADLIVGFYLIAIAVANAYFAGTFNVNHEIWLRSGVCLTSSFLISLSTLMSTFILFLITLDRYLYLVYPFDDIRLSYSGLIIALLSFWIVSIVFTGLPIIYSFNQPSYNRLYENNAACLPSNIKNLYMLAWLLVYCGITLTIWIVISIMYLVIIITITKSRKATNRQITKFEKIVMAKMITIVATDLICWLPFYVVLINGLVHLEVDTHTLPFIAVLSLPLNSCINPILYTMFTTRFIDNAHAILTSTYRLLLSGSKKNLIEHQIMSQDRCEYQFDTNNQEIIHHYCTSHICMKHN